MNNEVTTIGPECFTDGEVICYKGENYTRRPRTITTAAVEDVDAFADGTVILDSEGEAWQKSGHMWYLAAGGYLDKGPADFLPVTVLYEPQP